MGLSNSRLTRLSHKAGRFITYISRRLQKRDLLTTAITHRPVKLVEETNVRRELADGTLIMWGSKWF